MATGDVAANVLTGADVQLTRRLTQQLTAGCTRTDVEEDVNDRALVACGWARVEAHDDGLMRLACVLARGRSYDSRSDALRLR